VEPCSSVNTSLSLPNPPKYEIMQIVSAALPRVS